MNFKFILFAITLILSLSANAQSDTRLSGGAKALLSIINGDHEKREQWIKKSSNDRFLRNAFKSANTLTLSSPGLYEEKAEEFMIEMIRDRFENDDRWKKRNNSIKNGAWENNALIELDRIEHGKTNLRLISAAGVVQYDLSGSGMVISGQRQSSMLMRGGNPPIGPDGGTIKLCRMFKSPHASFFELTNGEHRDFIKLTNSKLTNDEACLNHRPAYRKYWSGRSMSF